jgi:hypothetical protein
MPAVVEIQESNGKKTRMDLPVEIWQRGGTWSFHANTTSTISRVTIDPDQKLPDYNSKNNTWKGEAVSPSN